MNHRQEMIMTILMSNLDSLVEFTNELRNSLPIPEIKRRQIVERAEGTLYNIHKRSLPVGIDKIVFIGLLRSEADKEILKLIYKESKRRNEENNNQFFYFDIIPIESTENEQSIYYNEV